MENGRYPFFSLITRSLGFILTGMLLTEPVAEGQDSQPQPPLSQPVAAPPADTAVLERLSSISEALHRLQEETKSQQISNESTTGQRLASISAAVKRLEDTTGTSSSKGEAFQQQMLALSREIKHLSESNKPESLIEKVAWDFVSNTLWEWFGFSSKSGSSSGLGAKLVSLVGFLFLVARIYYFFKDRSRKGGDQQQDPPTVGRRFVDAGVTVYLIIAVVLLISLSVTGGLFRKSVTAKDEFQGLRRDIDKMRSTLDAINRTVDADRMLKLAKAADDIKAFPAAAEKMTTTLSETESRLEVTSKDVRRHTAAFWLQVLEMIVLVAVALAVGALAYDKFA